MAPYLAAVRNYWALLPAIAICVALILVYAVPTLINPQWTSNVLAVFRQHPEDDEKAGKLGPKQARSRRGLAGFLVVAALALIGFNVALNREANGCYQAAKAWGAIDDKEKTADPCINMIYGAFFSDGEGGITEDNPQPVTKYQVVQDKKPKYLRWIQNRPSYDDVDIAVGITSNCSLDLRVIESDEKITVALNTNDPCPPSNAAELVPVKLKKPLGDRPIVTVDDKPLEQINPDMDSWFTVLKKLATGG